MTFQYSKVAVMGTHQNPNVRHTLNQVIELLISWSIDVVIERDSAFDQQPDTAHIACIDDIKDSCDLIIVVGGDGNLLQAGRVFSRHNTPVCGINRGQLGFLTDLNPDDLAPQLQAILEGKHIQESRFLLECDICDQQQCQYTANALNDVVLFPGDLSQMINFEVHINQKFAFSQRADGLIISTPTGSTAYALSAGGAILEPSLEAVILAPICPHTLSSRPIVIDSKNTIQIILANTNSHPRVSFDGQSHVSIQPGNSLLIQRQPQALTLLHPQNHDYFHTLRTKLNWGAQLIAKSG